MTELSITRALAELKNLDKRINKLVTNSVFMSAQINGFYGVDIIYLKFSASLFSKG